MSTMGILGQPSGIFDLDDSDVCVGSFMQRKDLMEILGVSESDLSSLTFRDLSGYEVVDERDVQRLWYNNVIPNAFPCSKGRSKISLDEYKLKAVVSRTYPKAKIEQQVPMDRKYLDFKITLNGIVKIVEFHGPFHFTIFNNSTPEVPSIRKKRIEDRFGIECVIWPYWIQICATNVKALFENVEFGYGALWSTNILFGSFVFEDSAQIIEEITGRFKAVDQSGYGYFYSWNSRNRNNPEHPIVQNILDDRKNVYKIIPKGHKEIERWIPESVRGAV
jgi:hypothetical protein